MDLENYSIGGGQTVDKEDELASKLKSQGAKSPEKLCDVGAFGNIKGLL